MRLLVKYCGLAGVLLALAFLTGCQVPGSSSTTAFSLNGGQSTAPEISTSEDDAVALQFAALTRLPKLQDRPYHRALYDGDLELDIVANPKIDGITGREIALLSPSFRRRQASLPFARRAILYNSIIRKHAQLNGIYSESLKARIFC